VAHGYTLAKCADSVLCGLSVDDIQKSIYDSGYVNAIIQLRNHIHAGCDKPNSQTKRVYELMDYMLENVEMDR